MPNHEQSMCELKNKKKNHIANRTSPLFSPNLPSKSWAGSEFCEPLPAQKELPCPTLGAGDITEPPALGMADETLPL